MEDTSAVLVIVTIPTQSEEARLKAEFIARKLDIRSDQIDISTISTTLPTVSNGDNQNPTATKAETVSTTNIELIDKTPLTSNDQYNTFSKRRRLSEADTVNHVTFRRKPSDADGGSLKQIELEQLELEKTPFISRKSADTLSSITDLKSNNKRYSGSVDLETPSDTCMEKIVREILKKFQILNAVWTTDSQGHKYQVIFTIEFNEIYEKILEKFFEWGIGDREGSSVSVMNCIVAKAYTEPDEIEEDDVPKTKENVNAQQKQSAWERFMNSVQCRLNVSQLIRDVRQNASITFDFIILVVSASILAAFGLVENSVVFLAASMLISPLMGPIIAAIFGTAIKDRSLGVLGLKNELLGILLATSVGFIFGLIVCTIDDRYSIGEGLTTEMISRCEIHSLVVGIFTAIPSGAAGAIGILGGNVGSLVGVAISASLLPPAVNSGLLWALACLYKAFEEDINRYPSVIKTHIYSENQATELAVFGFLSMSLTIVNIICIYLMGLLVLKVKEIAPISSQSKFWKRDIKVARVLSRTGDTDPNAVIINEFTNLPKEDQKAIGLDSELLRNINTLDDSSYQHTWSPIGNQYMYETRYEPRHDNYTTVHQLERLYSTVNKQRDQVDRRSRFSIAQRRSRRNSDMAGVSYKLLTEKRQRLSSNERGAHSNFRFSMKNSPTLNEEGSEVEYLKTPNEERKGRKFIVTPASEDPLNSQDRKEN